MLIGTWKNIEDLENSLCIAELEIVINAARDREHREFKQKAAVQGFNLDEDEQVDVVEKVEEMKQRIFATQQGKSKEEVEFQELGFGYVTE